MNFIQKLTNLCKKAAFFIRNDLWRTTGEDLTRGRRFAYSSLKTLVLSVKGFNNNDLNMRANSLTYSLMFAIVPILAFIVAIAKGFGFDSVIEDALNKSFLSNYHIVPTIMEFVQRYLETAQGGVFIGVGIFILLWAVYSFFRNVEDSFNKIWQVKKDRSILSQVTNYLTVLLLVPILIIASSGVSIFVNTSLADDTLFAHMLPLYRISLKCIPWLTSWLIFCLMYKAIPNTKVQLMSALVPGIIVGTLVQVLQLASVYIIMFLSRTSIVYGTFAAIPLLLTWVQWTCLLILCGAELSYSMQSNEDFDFQMDTETMSRRYKDYITLYICYLIIKRFENGESPLAAQDLAQTTKLPVRIVNQLLLRLSDVQIITRIPSESENENAHYQPALDINKITIGMVFDHIDRQGTEGFLKHRSKNMEDFWSRWVELKKADTDINRLLVKDIM